MAAHWTLFAQRSEDPGPIPQQLEADHEQHSVRDAVEGRLFDPNVEPAAQPDPDGCRGLLWLWWIICIFWFCCVCRSWVWRIIWSLLRHSSLFHARILLLTIILVW